MTDMLAGLVEYTDGSFAEWVNPPSPTRLSVDLNADS